MAVTTLDFESGVAGAAVSANWTGAGFTTGLVDGGQAMVYTGTAGEYFHGSRGIKITATLTSSHAYGLVSGLATARCAADVCMKWPSVSTADFHQIRFMTSGGVAVATLLMNSAGKIRLLGNGGATIFTLTATTPTNAFTRLKLWVQPGASAVTGSAKLEVWNTVTNTLIQPQSSTTTADFGTALIDSIRFGNSGNYATTYFMDLAGYDPAATDLMPDLGANLPPTVTITSGTQNVAAGATVNLTATPVDTDGTIVSQVWTYDYPVSGGPSLTGGTTTTPSFTAGAAGSLYILRCTVTDNQGATGFATTAIRVPLAAGSELTPLAAFGGTGVAVTNTGGAASEEAALADGTLGSPNDTTFLLFGAATGTEVERRWRLKPSVALNDATFTPRVALDTAGTFTGKIRLYQSSTLIKEWTLTTPTTSFGNQTLALSSVEAATISDWGILWIAAVEST